MTETGNLSRAYQQRRSPVDRPAATTAQVDPHSPHQLVAVMELLPEAIWWPPAPLALPCSSSTHARHQASDLSVGAPWVLTGPWTRGW
jgi:hypothetical protein